MANIWKIGSNPGLEKNKGKKCERFLAECWGQGFTAVGWAEIGNLKKFEKLEDLIKKWTYPDPPPKKKKDAQQLWNFAKKIQQGDIIFKYISLDKEKKNFEFWLGKVKEENPYYYEEKNPKDCICKINPENWAPHRINVEWIAECVSPKSGTMWGGAVYKVREDKLSKIKNEKIREYLRRQLLQDDTFDDPAELDISDKEGRKSIRKHIHRERSAKLISEFKKRIHSYKCRVCDFDFEQQYGNRGAKFIEAHHTKPVASLKEDEEINIKDLVEICSNCHRMLHRTYPPLEWGKLVVKKKYK